jgi:hypothetical protein
MDDQNMLRGKQQSHPDDLDLMLDVALAQYRAVEPRAGLEERVLANLRAHEQEPASKHWFTWPALAVVAALALIAATVVLMSRSEQPTRQVAHKQIQSGPAARASMSLNAASDNSSRARVLAGKSRSTRSATIQSGKVEALPKLDQFPSPQPLTEQEQILAMYVSRFHKQAILLAEVRAAEIRNEQAEDAKKWRAISDGNTDQSNQQTTNQ